MAGSMSDTLYRGFPFRTFIILEDSNRAVLAFAVDTSLRTERIIRVLDHLKTGRNYPRIIRVDNDQEFLLQRHQESGKAKRVLIYHIQPGCQTQKAFIERINFTYRNKLLDLYLFRSLKQLRAFTAQWLTIYSGQRPHDSLQGTAPYTHAPAQPRNPIYKLSA